MSDTAHKQSAPPVDPLGLGPAVGPDQAIAPWVLHAMERAAAAGIDPHRVALALGIPWRALDASPSPDRNGEGLR